MGADDRRPRRLLRRCRQVRSDRGMVTAETATALPALMVITAGLLFVIGAVGTQLRCVDESREAARELARGTDPAAVTRELLAAQPSGRLTVTRSDGNVTATVTARAPLFGPLAGHLRALLVTGSSTALDETALDETALDETALDETALDETALDEATLGARP